MSAAKMAIIAMLVLSVSILGLSVLSSSSHTISPPVNSETMTATGGTHYNLDLKESVNVKSSP